MKLKKTIWSCGACILVAGSQAGAASYYVDEWSFATKNGVITNWQPTYAPDVSSGTGVVLAVANYTGAMNSQAGGDAGLYTLFATPSYTLTTGDFDETLTTIVLHVTATTTSATYMPDLRNISLDFNAANTGLAPTSWTLESEGMLSGAMEAELFHHTLVWDVSGLGESDGLTVKWTIGQHRVVTGVSLEQIPEPGVGLLAVVSLFGFFRRRR